ncbi:uncharacterized protein LTR77_002024 [Saxophila tyrrhenica]|uniref:Arylsulfatase n=1 Tax=Saxophila tyrrhenica TaxID=1690608 RepID=A0AAV9PI89_9PEZI|nr:hypothetical protein LTR77_002024 [Saxophila tyrrhenica]
MPSSKDMSQPGTSPPSSRDSGRGSTEKASEASGRKRRLFVLIGIVCIIVVALALGLGLGLGLKKAPEREYNHKGPNVLVVMTDDQDMLLDSMSVMPNVQKLLGEEGVTYSKHYCTVAWCCPSRVNFLTGRAAHNTNVTSGHLPYGGWKKFLEEGLNSKYLPVWISNAGIRTYYAGKLLNGFNKMYLQGSTYPSSWTDSSFLIDPATYYYYDSWWSNNGNGGYNEYKGTHTTDVTQEKALSMLDDAASSGDQFFMMVAPVAPHQELKGGVKPPPVPEAWRGKFAGAKAPRTPNFNPDSPSGASWVRNLPKLSEKKLDICDKTFEDRLGNIAAIDDMVSTLVQKLDDYGILNNTYILYTSDNGFHIGNHRLSPGKRCPYEEDINIPLLIRGPNVAKGKNSSITNSHTDMAPTILQMLGVPLQDDFDGQPIAYTEEQLSGSTKSEHVNVEFWNAGNTPIGLAKHDYYNNTYKALRLMSDEQSFYYSTWCTGEREFYDMRTDSQQLHNRLADKPEGSAVEYYGRSERELFHRLEALLMVLKSCKMDSCRDPWATLFPGGEVVDIRGAMNSTYDAFFKDQPKISYSSCIDGHVVAEEGPQTVMAFG